MSYQRRLDDPLLHRAIFTDYTVKIIEINLIAGHPLEE